MKRSILTLVGALTLCTAISQNIAAQGFFDSLKNAVGGKSEALDPNETYLDQLNSAGAEHETCGGDGQTTLLNALVEQGLGIVAGNAIFPYLQQVTARLLKATPYPECAVTVFVTPHDTAQAVALADGGILVALGFLKNLKNEDEVAALLAHELSHILRGHHASDSFTETQDGFLKGLETMNTSGGMMLGMVDPNLQQGLSATLTAGEAFYTISESMIAPAWTVEQEDEADLLGTDLLVAAGYNPRAMAAIMDIIAAQEASMAEIEKQRAQLYHERLQGTVVDAVTKTDISNPLSILGAVANVSSAAIGSDQKTHRSAADRKASVNAYIKKFHRKHRRRNFSTEAWQSRLTGGDIGQMFAQYRDAAAGRRAVFTNGDLDQALRNVNAAIAGAFNNHAYPRLAKSEVHLKQGDREAALASLEAAMERPEAPWQIYRSYADIQLGLGNTSAAGETVERADRKFGRPIGIAPFAIKVFRAAEDEERVSHYMERCQESGSRAHIQICKNAAGQ